MSDFPVKSLTRRSVAAGLAGAALIPGLATAAQAGPRVVTILGDSITAGFGLPYRDSLPVQLEAALNRLGANVRVRGAGVSGDTTAGGLARVDFSVQADTRLCVIALGGNDLLRGLPTTAMRANLTKIVRRLKARRIPVMLCGLTAPPTVNAAYVQAFNAVFGQVARAEGVPLYANLLAGVVGSPKLNQADRIHPNAAGVKVLAARLAPAVARALR